MQKYIIFRLQPFPLQKKYSTASVDNQQRPTSMSQSIEKSGTSLRHALPQPSTDKKKDKTFQAGDRVSRNNNFCEN